MNHEESAESPAPGDERVRAEQSDESAAGGPGETRGIDLGGILGDLLADAHGEPSGPQAAPSESGGGLGDLLGSLLGGGNTADLSGQAGALGLSPSVLQAIVPLIAGALLRGEQNQGGLSRAALGDLAEGRAGAADALTGTGLLQEIMRRTGLDKSGALAVIAAVLKALGLGKTPSSHSKPKPRPKPKPGAKPKPRPKPSASTGAKPHAKPKPKPKPAAHAASGTKPKPKPRPKPSASAKPKPKPRAKARPRRSGEVGEGGESSTSEPGA